LRNGMNGANGAQVEGEDEYVDEDMDAAMMDVDA